MCAVADGVGSGVLPQSQLARSTGMGSGSIEADASIQLLIYIYIPNTRQMLIRVRGGSLDGSAG